MFNRDVKMTDGEKAELKREIMAVTPVVTFPTKKKETLSPRGKKVLAALDRMPSDWRGSKAIALRTFAEALLDEKLDNSTHISGLPRLTGDIFKKYMVIVPEENTGDHLYTVGKPVLVLQDQQDYCMQDSTAMQNHCTPEDCRFATEAEIDNFLNTLQKNADAATILKSIHSLQK